jgi:hypothetical protein
MNKHLRSILLVLLLTVSLAAVPLPARASIPQTGGEVFAQVAETTLPGLEAFIGQVKTGSAVQVTGLYVADVFAYPVIQQPAGKPGYVSPLDGRITQFAMASSYGSLGFLAHNTLAGARFSDIEQYQLINVVYGDGHYVIYQVMEIRRFQATRPASPYSSFVDLETNKTLSASDLFTQTYGVRNSLVLQTCITLNGLDTWGRLFILATPYIPGPVTNR